MTRRERLVDAQPEGRIQFWTLLGARARYGSRSFGPAHTIEVQAGQAIECFDLSLTVSESARELQNVEQRPREGGGRTTWKSRPGVSAS
jgi:hypothetical protein